MGIRWEDTERRPYWMPPLRNATALRLVLGTAHRLWAATAILLTAMSGRRLPRTKGHHAMNDEAPTARRRRFYRQPAFWIALTMAIPAVIMLQQWGTSVSP